MAGRPDFALERARLLQGDPTGLSHGSAGMLAQYAAAAAENAALAARQVGLADITGTSPLTTLGPIPGQYPTDRYFPPSMSLHSPGTSPWSSYLTSPSVHSDAYKSLLPAAMPWPPPIQNEGFAAYGLGAAYSPYVPYLPGAETPIFSQSLTGLSQSSAVYHRIYDLHKEAKPPDLGVHAGLGSTLMTPHAGLSYGRPNLAACSPMVSPNVTPISQPLIKSEGRMDRPCHHDEQIKKRHERTESRERSVLPRTTNPKTAKVDMEGKGKQKSTSVKLENGKNKSCAEKKKPVMCHTPESLKVDRVKSNQNTPKCQKELSVPKTEVSPALKSKPVQSKTSPSSTCVAKIDVKTEASKGAPCAIVTNTAQLEANRTLSGNNKPGAVVPSCAAKPSLETEKAILKSTIFKREPSDMCFGAGSDRKSKKSVHCDENVSKQKPDICDKKALPVENVKPEPEQKEPEVKRTTGENEVKDIKPLKSEPENVAPCEFHRDDPGKVVQKLEDKSNTATDTPKVEVTSTPVTSPKSEPASSPSSSESSSSSFSQSVITPGGDPSPMVTSTSPGGSVYAMYPSTLPMSTYLGQGQSIVTTDGKPLAPYSTATSHLMPLYQSLYSLSKEQAGKEGNKVHATTFTPEVGIIPTVSSVTNPSPLKNEEKNDQNRNYIQQAAPKEGVAVANVASPEEKKFCVKTKEKGSPRQTEEPKTKNSETVINEKSDSETNSVATSSERTREPGVTQANDKDSIPLTMPYRDIIHDYGQPRNQVTLTEAHLSQSTENKEEPGQLDRRLYDWQYSITQPTITPSGYLFTNQMQQVPPGVSYADDDERRRLIDSGWIPGQPTTSTPVQNMTMSPNQTLGSPHETKPVIPVSEPQSAVPNQIGTIQLKDLGNEPEDLSKSATDMSQTRFSTSTSDGSQVEKVTIGGSKSTEEAVTMATTGTATIPIGIAVARQRQEHNKENKETSNTTLDPIQQRQNKEREEFLREQKELLATQTKNENNTAHRDIKTELGSNLIVTGGNAPGSVIPWRDNDASRSLGPWLQTGGTMAPTYWLGQGPYSITHPVHLPNVDPSHIPVTPPNGGYKLAQDPMTGQLFLIPATNIDVIDPTRLWPGLTGATPIQPIIAQQPNGQIQQSTNTATQQPQQQKVANFPVQIAPTTHQVPKAEDGVVTDRPDAAKPPDRAVGVSTDPTVTSAETSTSPFLNRVTVSCNTGQPYAYPYPATPLPYFYDPSVIPVHGVSMTDNIMPRAEPSVQSRGTSPMTITSAASPAPERDSPDLQEDLSSDQTKLITHSTISVQTSPDVEQMSAMREQSCQTSETEKEVLEDSEDEREKLKAEVVTVPEEKEKPVEIHVVEEKNDSTIIEVCDEKVESVVSESSRQQETKVEESVCDKKSTTGNCDNIFDIISDIHKSSKLDTLCCATQLTEQDIDIKPVEKEVLIDNSYKNLESNMAASYLKHEEDSPVDGLALLSAMAEKRAAEEKVSQKHVSPGSSVKREPEMFVFNTDINKNYENIMKRSPSMSGCSSPTFVLKRERKDSANWSPLSGDMRFFGTKQDPEVMDPMELEMRMKLAELQRKYKEKQKELAKLQPKKDKTDDDKNPKRGPGRPRKRKLSKKDSKDNMDEKSPEQNDEQKKKRKKRHKEESEGEKKRRKEEHKMKKQDSGLHLYTASDKKLSRTISGGSTSSSDIPLSEMKQKLKRTESLESSSMYTDFPDTGLQLLAKFASKESAVSHEPKPKKKKVETDGPKEDSSVKTPVCNKRKPGRPKKLSPEQPSGTETIVAKKPKNFGLLQMKEKSKEMDRPLNVHIDTEVKTPIFIDEEWNLRRSERIFLSDSSPQASPSLPRDLAYKSPMKVSPSKIPVPSSRKMSTEKKTMKHLAPPLAPSEKGEKTKKPVIAKAQKPKPLPPSAFAFKEKVKYKYVYSSSDSSSDNDSDGDNIPLSSFKDKPATPVPRNCTIEKDELEDGLRVLILMSNLFYEAEVKAIQPPDIYGVVIFGERGNRPHIMTQEEVLKEAVIDVKPSSPKFLPEGTRVCAYWSQQFSCLYPGTVAKESPNPDADKNLIIVEFDDGDSGKIPIDHIRMLPENFPLCSFSSSEPSPLLLINKRKKRFSSDDFASESKERKPSVSDTAPTHQGEEVKKPTVKRGPGRPKKLKLEPETPEPGSFEMGRISEQLENIVFKVEKKKKMKEPKNAREEKVKKIVKESEKKKEIKKKPSIIGESHFAKAAELRMSMGNSSEDSDDDDDDGSEESSVSDSSDCSCESSDSSSEESSSESNSDDIKGKRKKDKKRERRQSAESRSKIAAFLPARQLWRWSGKGTRRPGMKGKAKKEFYKAITRGRETIKVGDCAVFMSTGRPHLPYVGHIESFWEGWGGNMVVKVTWFYHPEETKGGKKLLKVKGALYESPHGDENDVQTISHKCEVLAYTDYKKRKISSENDNNDVYYLAGNYDPIVGTVVFESDVPHV